jgi:hypothetical protein
MTKMGIFRLITRSSTFDRSDEFSYRTVIGSLGLGGKETAWNFAVPAMIGHALAALAPARTGFIRAGTFFQIFFEIAFHNPPYENHKSFCHRGHRDHRATNRILIYPSPPIPGERGRVRGHFHAAFYAIFR